ncbi:MAG: metalloprotease PmbA, partial [Thioalkalispiraceae bacterium]
MNQIIEHPKADESELLNTDELKSTVEFVLAEAKAKGATDAEAGLSIETGLSVNVRKAEVETVEHNRDRSFGLTVYFGQRKGSASTTDFSRQAIIETVQAACDIARYTEQDKYAGLADKDRLAMSYPDLELSHPWALTTEDAIEIARQCEDAALSVDKRINNSEGGYLTTHKDYRIYANSHGFLGDYFSTRHSTGCTIIASQDERMERDYWYSISRCPDQLEAPEQIGRKAARRVLQRLGATQTRTQRVPVVFQPEVARGLLGHFVRAISGGAQYRHASFLLDKQGEQVFPDRIRIDERPHIKKAVGSAPFDSEGVANSAHDLVTDGVLQTYVLDSYAARRLGRETTGNAGGVHNLFIQHDDKDLNALLKEMNTGILVTEVMGQGVNIVTGDYSRGGTGFWVENGEIQYPIEEFTLASNLADMYKNLVLVGNDVDTR